MLARTMLGCLAAVLMVAGTVSASRADLHSFLAEPDPAFHWTKLGEQHVEGGTVYDLHMVSQVWHGITWEHHLQIFKPDNVEHSHFCTLLNTGGNGGPSDAAVGMMAARASHGLFAILFNIPNQPLFGGKSEDALVVYTWLKYMETGDDSWPLHFPMCKAVIKSMDAIQQFMKSEKQPAVTQFLITGASKRGWTTWLAGASQDKRIKAIAPMVIDTLNVAAQGPHQLAAYGAFSTEIDDYTRAGIFPKLKTPMGRKLLGLEDPYSYRKILTLPKLLILGTNDHYWAQDALNLYWNGLEGPKWVMYDPNSGHGLEDRVRVYNALTSFADCIASRTPWPTMKWAYSAVANGADLTVSSDTPMVSARMFHADAPTQDFRESHWSSTPVDVNGSSFTGHMDNPATGYRATFAEITYTIRHKTFTLSTQIRILKAGS
ncbi:MAG: hypothetical protein KGJ62_09850 [Armatimonadetes bacterium]|nr:hypothetical protein [Armatimonadota bacterium]MDE2208032.1 hypothetical protein [Armatimonadota bacterium]